MLMYGVESRTKLVRMSAPPAVLSARMPLPDPKYLRPSIDPTTMESHLQFERECVSGDLANVTKLANVGSRSPEYLTHGLMAAIYQNNVQIVEFILDKGVAIDRAVSVAATSVKSLPIFQLLMEHGWDINAPILGNETALM